MKTPLEVIKGFGAPTDSYIAAVGFFNEKPMMTKEEYERGYSEIIYGEGTVEFLTHKHARFFFLYAVQETIRVSQHAVPDMDEIAKDVEFRVNALEAKHPEMFKDYETGEVKMDATGKPKPKKGAKKDHAKRVYADEIHGRGLSRKDAIALLAEKVGLTVAGASTYYANLKAGRY